MFSPGSYSFAIILINDIKKTSRILTYLLEIIYLHKFQCFSLATFFSNNNKYIVNILVYPIIILISEMFYKMRYSYYVQHFTK